MATRLIGSLFIQSSTKCLHALRVLSYGENIKDNSYHRVEKQCPGMFLENYYKRKNGYIARAPKV